MINEEAILMPSIKECKNFMNCFDALFVRDQELWFGSYGSYYKADPDQNPSNITIYSSGTIFSMPKESTLCFYDIGSHTWVMILSKHCRISWQVCTEDEDDDNIYLRMLASIAEDELKRSRGVHNDLVITNRIKERYRCCCKSVRRRGIRIDYSYDNHEKACSELKKSLNERYGIRPPQPKFVQFNGDYTTVVWKDGSHTVVKRSEGEEYDEEKAILFAIVKHLCKDNGCEMSRYFDKFFKNERNINKED